MKSMTLVAKHLYFGMDPLNLRDAANRVVARLPEDTTVRPVVRLDALVEDFRLTAGASRALVDQLVADGVLQPLSDRGADFEVTTRMREIARARIIEPLPRTEAQRLLARSVELAKRFNRTATRNKYEIEELAVYGAYMSRDADLSDLMLGLTGRRRAPGQRRFIGRATTPTEGTERIRGLFERQSTFVKVAFFRHLTDMPRPFAVVFRAEV
jgi:hypothetical protein